jgi:hypothetical protein
MPHHCKMHCRILQGSVVVVHLAALQHVNQPSCAEEIKLVGDLVFLWCCMEELSTLWMTYCI